MQRTGEIFSFPFRVAAELGRFVCARVWAGGIYEEDWSNGGEGMVFVGLGV